MKLIASFKSFWTVGFHLIITCPISFMMETRKEIKINDEKMKPNKTAIRIVCSRMAEGNSHGLDHEQKNKASTER